MFTSIKELKDRILATSEREFFDAHLLTAETSHFSKEKIEFVAQTISEEYRINISDDEVIVVGSAKLGFALHDKFRNKQKVADAFRPYSAESDIDISVCSPSLFRLLWQELSGAFCRNTYLPVDSGMLGDYLCYGWLRFDKYSDLPAAQLTRYHRFKKVTATIRRNKSAGHPKADLGVFYDVDHLSMYQMRSIANCRRKLEAI